MFFVVIVVIVVVVSLLQSSSGIGYGKKLVGVCEVEEVDEVRIVTIRSSVQVPSPAPIAPAQ